MTETPIARHPDEYPRGALITGAARRIGRAIALDLARDGWAVAVHYHDSAEAAREVVAEIEAGGGHVSLNELESCSNTPTRLFRQARRVCMRCSLRGCHDNAQ